MEAIKILYTPQVNAPQFTYTFGADTVAASLDSASDIFDFSTLPDGVATGITSTLAECPVKGAERIAGVLHITLLSSITEEATEAEKYPDWVVV